MTEEHKRAIRRAGTAIAEMARDTIDDPMACNHMIAMPARALGAAVGPPSAFNGLSVDEMNEGLTKALRIAQDEAAKTYGAALALEKRQTGGEH